MGHSQHTHARAVEKREPERQRKPTARDIRASEKQYRLLFDGNPEPMWVLDRNSLAFLAVNDTAVKRYGYTREEFLGMTILDIRTKSRSTTAKLGSPESIPKRRATERWRHQLKDGTIIHVEVTSHSIEFRGKDAILVLVKEITERLQNEEQLRQSEERFSKAFRSSPSAMTISTMAEGRYIDANEAFLRMFGRRREDLIDRSAIELNIWAVPEDRHRMIDELQQTGKVVNLQTVFNSRSMGPRNVQVSAEVIQLDGHPCVLAITEDVTDTWRLEEQSRQAQKMEAVGRLAGGVAHDFNNMLGVILGYCDLSRNHPSRAALRDDIGHIKKAAQKAARLTRQLLAFSRQEVLRPSVINLNAVVQDMSQMLLRVIAENIELTLKPYPSLGNVVADLGQLEQIVVNLVVNARDAMPHGGRIVIETANADLDASSATRLPDMRPGLYVLLSVTDTGCGMNPDTLSRIFEPFYTTKPPGEGSGLGLSMVYGAVQQNHGYILVESEPGNGSTFKLFFPMVDEPATIPSPMGKDTTTTRGFETVLLVEDEDDLRHLTAEFLRVEGYQVLEAAQAEAALAMATKYADPIHLLLTDVTLRGMSGRELGSQLLKSLPTLKVIYVSGYARDLVPHQQMLDPGVTFLEKPYARSALLREMRTLLDRAYET